MKVRIVKTGKTEEYNDSFAARLIEQGEAVASPAEAFPMNPPEEPAGKTAAEEPAGEPTAEETPGEPGSTEPAKKGKAKKG